MTAQRSMAAVLLVALFVTALPTPAASAPASAHHQQVKAPRELNLDEAMSLLGASTRARPNSTTLAGPSPFRSTAGVRVPQKLWLGLVAGGFVYAGLMHGRLKY
jgi:hypothetical protein